MNRTQTVECKDDIDEYNLPSAMGGLGDFDEEGFDFDTSLGLPIDFPKNGTGLPMIIPGPQHINVVPKQNEELYVREEGLISRMMLLDAQRLTNTQDLINKVAYDCIDPSPYYPDSAQESNSNKGRLRPFYRLQNDKDNTLVFESRFESGNLRRAIQVYDYEYDLILKFDVNTRGNTQWFYFSVQNARKGIKYKFNVINLMKKDSLYNIGMKPLIYSEHDAKHKGRGWFRGGTDICYYQNNIRRKSGYYYTLTFSYVVENDKDVIYFAYCFPYTYTDLQNYLRNLEQDPFRRRFMRRRVLCKTLAGNNCDLLTITSFSGDPQSLKNRKGIVVTSRVHPGESNSSWMMKGFIDYLTGPSLDAKILRDNFVFKIVPMLNPDGVINGNYRCSLAGVDLNRRWNDPSPKLHPSIYHTKNMIKRFSKDREVIMFCDLHGHSRKKNIFIYGCELKTSTKQRLEPRVLPRILWKISHNFSFQDCSFGLQKSKESTARIVVFRLLGIVNSFTLEASFCGADFGINQDVHFSTKHLEQMGHFCCEGVLDYCDPTQTRVQQAYRELAVLYPENDPSVFSDHDSEGSSDVSSEDECPKPKKASVKKAVKKKVKKSVIDKKKSLSDLSGAISTTKRKGVDSPPAPLFSPTKKNPDSPLDSPVGAKKKSKMDFASQDPNFDSVTKRSKKGNVNNSNGNHKKSNSLSEKLNNSKNNRPNSQFDSKFLEDGVILSDSDEFMKQLNAKKKERFKRSFKNYMSEEDKSENDSNLANEDLNEELATSEERSEEAEDRILPSKSHQKVSAVTTVSISKNASSSSTRGPLKVDLSETPRTQNNEIESCGEEDSDSDDEILYTNFAVPIQNFSSSASAFIPSANSNNLTSASPRRQSSSTPNIASRQPNFLRRIAEPINLAFPGSSMYYSNNNNNNSSPGSGVSAFGIGSFGAKNYSSSIKSSQDQAEAPNMIISNINYANSYSPRADGFVSVAPKLFQPDASFGQANNNSMTLPPQFRFLPSLRKMGGFSNQSPRSMNQIKKMKAKMQKELHVIPFP